MKKLATVIISMAFGISAYAHTPVEKSAQSAQNLSDVYQLAKKNNASYMASEATFQSTQQNVPIALGQLLPIVDVGYVGQGNYTSAPGTDSTTGLEKRTKYFTQAPSVTVAQALFNWSAWGGYSYSVYQAKADAISFAEAQQNLILNTSQAYFEILQQQDNLAYARANESWNKELLNQNEEKYKVGLAAITDVQATKAQYEQSVASTVQAENDLATAYASLAQITGQKISSVQKLSDKFPFDKPKPASMKEWLNIALKQNLSVVQSQYLLQSSEAGVSAAWGLFIPNATLNANATRTLNYQNPNNTAGSNTAYANVTVAWNVLNGGADYATVKQSQYNKEAARYNLLEAERATESSLKTAYLNVITDISQVEAYKQAVISAQASVDAMKASYEVGTSTIVDLLRQQQQLFEAQQQYSQAKYAYINDLLTLKQVAGVLSYQDVDAINKWLTTMHTSKQSSSNMQASQKKTASSGIYKDVIEQ
ncbi:TolC family outer membrane protein [Fangia hongkongensis]|uniref:TolC family outer membrane protein n=1 Tax=Fangia hongkongensis TaxID=270495 RepID=UPI000371D435|nr:TolC family outer membrane protein [Fangia hongkongensis]MBK2124700.1 TolC family outer membrane protein [Fangia hongkongensis]